VRLPAIDGPEPAAGWLATGVVAEPGGRPIGAGDHIVVVGPEGGWSADELLLVDADRRVDLADHVLRVETAAVAAVVLMAHHRAGGVAR
jgi:16S rRNA U1498 N3-methylase RsmE